MSKYFFIAMISLSICAAQAEVQSPLYTDDLGRSHFLGRGGYSTVKQVNMEANQAAAVNDAVNEFSDRDEIKKDAELDIMDVIKEKPVVPAGSHKSSFTSEKGKMDATRFGGYGGTNIPSGVNDSKTIYTDDLGRLHFFGKGNIIKE